MAKILIKTPAFLTTSISIYKKGVNYNLIPLDLYDRICLEKLNERKIKIIKENGYKIPTNDENIVYKVAVTLQNHKPNKLGAMISIKKNIPSFSGLSSQMSNAAGTLIALNKLWKFNLNRKELLKIAEQVDPKINKILNSYFKLSKKRIIYITILKLKYINIKKPWIDRKIIRTKNPYEPIIYKHFPDIKEFAVTLKKIGYQKIGISGKGPILYGISDKKILKNIINNKIDFIWSGKSCIKCS